MSATAEAAFRDAAAAGTPVFLPSICIVELTYLAERGRVPAKALEVLRTNLDDRSSLLRLAPLDRGVADAVARVPRDLVPDMPDRIIAATALAMGLPLVTRDAKIRAASVPTIW